MAALLRGCPTSLQRLSVCAQFDASHSTTGQVQLCLSRTAKPEEWELAGLRHIWRDWKRRAVPSENRARGKLVIRAVAAGRPSRIPQNEELQPVLPKKKKRPFVGGPPKRGKGRAMERAMLMRKPPNNGLLVKRLIPVAYNVMMARATVVEGVSRLVKVYPVKACRFCSSVHVGPIGHLIKECQGLRANRRGGQHEWLYGEATDVVCPVESYHLTDAFGRPVTHDERFDVERIPAVVELCIQAGVELPGYPTVRRTRPIDPRERFRNFAPLPADWPRFGAQDYERTYADRARSQENELDLKSDVLADSRLKEPASSSQDTSADSGSEDALHGDVVSGSESDGAHWEDDCSENEDDEHGEEDDDGDSLSSSEEGGVETKEYTECIKDEDDLRTIAEKTLIAWEEMRAGCQKLMGKYRVRACGYCPEIQVGPRGHKARNCGAFKHQWRNGQHGWQAASLDDLIPPQYVWHVVDMRNPLLANEFRKFYGQTPAVVELCHQAGADIPEVYKPRLRLDVVIPDLEEMRLAC